MRTPFMALLGSLLLPGLAPALAAESEPLVCFGTEPFWSLDLTAPGRATFSTPDTSPVTYTGSASALSPRQQSTWRGSQDGGEAGDILVAFLRAGDCSDGMSDTTHPFAGSVSMPDGRHLEGCCRRPQAALSAAALGNRTWRLVADWAPSAAGPGAGGAVTVNFSGGRVQGFSGCNQFTGGYTLDADGGVLTLGNMGATMMACAESAMAVEQRFLGAFSGEMQVAVSGDRLSLTPRGGGEALLFELAPAPQITGVEWEVTGFNNGRQAVVGPLLNSRLTLTFKDGRVSGHSGCNPFSGGYTVAGDTIEIQPLGSGRMACAPEVMEQEQAFLAALQAATKWTISRGMLDMHRADGQRALTAIPASDAR